RLWFSDGTPESTHLLKEFARLGDSSQEAFGVLEHGVVFTAEDPGSGFDLWTSDGTSSGTRPIADLRPDVASSDPRLLVTSRGNLVAATEPGATEELVRIDPDGRHTLLLDSSHPRILGESGGRVVFTEASGTLEPLQIASVDPETEVRTELLVTDEIFATASSRGMLFLIVGSTIAGFPEPFPTDLALWVTDGTPEGTLRLDSPGEVTVELTQDVAENLAPWRHGVLFTGHSPDTGVELWRSDGTPEGTELFHDLVPGSESSRARVVGVGEGRIYLLVRDEDGELDLGALDLGTGLFRSTGVESEFDGFVGTPIAVLRDRLLWFSGTELRSLGPEGNGGRVLGEFQRVGESSPHGGRILFSAAIPGRGSELWVTDGSRAGTTLVAEIQPGLEGSGPRSFFQVEGGALFRARTGGRGSELWFTDGTPSGTRALPEVSSGPLGSAPTSLQLLGEQAVFAAYRPDVGREVFTLEPIGADLGACVLDDQILCLGEGRFRVEATWHEAGESPTRARAETLTDDTGFFWFFDPDNLEIVTKILRACPVNGSYWLYASGLTDVGAALRIRDLRTGAVTTFENPPGRPFELIRTDSLASCR
ncbi:MAG: hypothetical protein R3234_08380, partial [Thermoanaerobaculia bacterium]|nr:hypothetical protein [Thermoanaerobaculia bacterium]